jgi:hypothetical protein
VACCDGQYLWPSRLCWIDAVKDVRNFAMLAAWGILSACGGPGAATTASDLPTLDRSASLAGPDVDRNGVRDDVDAYIKKNYTDPKEVAAVMQMAKGMQAAVLVDPKDKAATTLVSDNLDRGIQCAIDSFVDHAKASQAMRAIEAITPNTKRRLLAYLAYNHSQDGTVSEDFLPGTNTCD